MGCVRRRFRREAGRTILQWTSDEIPGLAPGMRCRRVGFEETLEPLTPQAMSWQPFPSGEPAAVSVDLRTGRTLMLGSYVGAAV